MRPQHRLVPAEYRHVCVEQPAVEASIKRKIFNSHAAQRHNIDSCDVINPVTEIVILKLYALGCGPLKTADETPIRVVKLHATDCLVPDETL